MADTSLVTRSARARLTPRVKPYYRRAGADLTIGYYKPKTKDVPGSWVARQYVDGKYRTETIGIADDRPEIPADGDKVLTFDQAESKARLWLKEKTTTFVAPATVADAVKVYIETRKARSPKDGLNAQRRLGHHVLKSTLASVALVNLTDVDLEGWRSGLRRGGYGTTGDKPLTSSTLARLFNDFRAALTAAARKSKAPAGVLTVITEGLRAPPQPARAREKQVLSDSDVHRLVEAASAHDADFGVLVLVLSVTGARFDQLARLTVGDLQAGARRVMVPRSWKGNRGAKVSSHIALPLDDEVVARLLPIAAGRPGSEPLLLHWFHRQVARTWQRIDRRPWSHAGEMARQWRSIVVATGLPIGTVPYALRHSSVVRGLLAGLPVTLVAKAHDTSVSMIERHYGAFIVDATEELLRRATLRPVSST